MPAKRASARGAKATKAVEKAAEVPAEPITIHVSGLQRPWQDAELKEVLVNAAGTEATEYRVNETRSDAYITVRAVLPSIASLLQPLAFMKEDRAWERELPSRGIVSSPQTH